MSLVLNPLLTLASPGGRRGRLSILNFHRVLPRPDGLQPDEPDAELFETQMRWLRSWFNVLPLSEGVRRLYDHELPARAACVTFDDGYSDNETIAAPILRRLGMTATFFVTTGYLDGSCMWNDCLVEAVRRHPRGDLDLTDLELARYPATTVEERRRSLTRLVLDVKHVDVERRRHLVDAILARCGCDGPRNLMMSPAQIRGLRALGMDVGAHTVTHPILTRVESAEARREIVDSRRDLENVLQEAVVLFAYPNGHPHHDYEAEHVAMVREAGYTLAVTTAPGASSSASDPHQLPRFAPWDRTRLRYGLRLLKNFACKVETIPAIPEGRAAMEFR